MHRQRTTYRAVLACVALLGGCARCGAEEEREAREEGEAAEAFRPKSAAEVRASVAGVLEPLPERVDVSAEKMKLGRRLFHDPKLSGDQTLSCATCHSLDHGGAEARQTSMGIRSQVGPINSPTVLNAQFNFRQFWDGRAADLAEQAAGPITNPIEMGGDWPKLVERLKADPTYASTFAALYPGGISQDSVIDAVVQYERSLVTPSRFDAFLRGDDHALSEQELRGLQRFKEVGCTSCHNGVNVGGRSFQKMGLVRNYFEERGGELTEADLGRYNVTHEDADKHFFKVPTLRNVAITKPYFHDGSQNDLASAVRVMARVQLGRDLSNEEVSDIVAFLGSLTGKIPDEARLPSTRAPAGAEAAAKAPHDLEDVEEAHPEAPVGDAPERRR